MSKWCSRTFKEKEHPFLPHSHLVLFLLWKRRHLVWERMDRGLESVGEGGAGVGAVRGALSALL